MLTQLKGRIIILDRNGVNYFLYKMNRDFINVNKIRMKIPDDLINRITKVKFLSTLFSLLRY